jgi:hypothetical protein
MGQDCPEQNLQERHLSLPAEAGETAGGIWNLRVDPGEKVNEFLAGHRTDRIADATGISGRHFIPSHVNGILFRVSGY